MRLDAQILNRFDSAADWVSENPTLASGELGIQSDGYFKIGDGTTDWGNLDYAGGSAELANYFLADGSRELAGHLLPEMTGASGVVSARDIGSSSQKIRRLYVHDAYIDAGSLYVNNKLVLQDDSGTITVSTDEDQDLKIRTTGTGDLVLESDNEVNSIAKGGIEFTVPSNIPTKHLNFTNLSSGGNLTFSAVGANAQVQFSATEEIDLTASLIDVNGALDVSAEITFGTLHHHNLTGLDDDDHSQYILATGTRAFTGKVTGVAPTENNQLATKSYVDGVVQGLDWQESVISMTNNASATATLGNRYISTETIGGWTINNIYEYNGTTWDETVSNEGIAAWVESDDVLYTFSGAAWIKFGSTITHDNLNAVDSGTYRHLNASQVTELTTSGICTTHTHSQLSASDGSPNPALSVDANGNIGIGTAVPYAKLDVQGTTRQSSLTTYTKTITTAASAGTYYIVRQFIDNSNWGGGGVLIEVFSTFPDYNTQDYGMYFAGYGYPENAAGVTTKIAGAIAPIWQNAVNISGNYYYRDLGITLPTYTSLTMRINSTITITTNLTAAQQDRLYLY